MKRRTKIGVVLATVAIVVLASVSMVSAHVGGDGSSGEQVRDRVAEILGVEPSALEDALVQARQEVRDELIDEKIDAAVEDGTITEDEAAEIRAWLDSRPDALDEVRAVKLGGHQRHRGGLSDPGLAQLVLDEVITQGEADEIAGWRDARPEALAELRPEGGGHRKFGRGHGRRFRFGPHGDAPAEAPATLPSAAGTSL